MALTEVGPKTGITNNTPITAANLNGAIRDPHQENFDKLAEAAGKFPLLWDPTSPPTITIVDSLVTSNVPPGIVYIDMSDGGIVATAAARMSLQGDGAYLFVPFDKNETPDAEVYIEVPSGWTINNTTGDNLPIPNRFRIHNAGATFMGKIGTRLFCKDGWYFRLLLGELESVNGQGGLAFLANAEADWSALQVELNNTYLSSIDQVRDSAVEGFLGDIDVYRRRATEEVYYHLQTSVSGVGIWPSARFITLDDPSSTGIVTQDINITEDISKIIITGPATINADKFVFRIKYPFIYPDRDGDDVIFPHFLCSITLATRRNIPFEVDVSELGPDANYNVQFQSDGEELIWFSSPGARAIYLP